jgi:ABC-type Fe3+-siderophore transport system permease subunit
MLDIRWPIGLMFSLIGLILVVYGALTGKNPMYDKHSLGININLVWGLLLLAFGLFMLISAKIAANAEKKKSK